MIIHTFILYKLKLFGENLPKKVLKDSKIKKSGILLSSSWFNSYKLLTTIFNF